MIVNLSEAAAHLGYRSRSTLSRLVFAGLLDAYRAGHQGRQLLLETHPPGKASLREHVQALILLRSDSPLARRRPARGIHAASPTTGPDWPAIAEALNAFLGASWPAPPWSADQAATVAMALSLAEEAADGGNG